MSRHARSKGILGIVAAGIGIGLVSVLWWWIGNRPAQLVVQPTPADAEVRIGEHVTQGRTERELDAGPVEVAVRARGHLPYTITVHLKPGAQVLLSPELSPVPVR